MEIHPPEHPIHTWRDFFVHMGTIVLGVVIALGFEQEKEHWHHSTDVKELHEHLHEEAARNVKLLERNLRIRLPDEEWLHLAISALIEAKSQNGVFKVKLPEAPNDASEVSVFDTVELPSRGVWTVAKTNGQVALLDPEEAKAYNRLDYNGEKYLAVSDLFSAAENDAYGLQARMRVKLAPGQTLMLRQAERDEVLRLFAQLLGHLDKLNIRTVMWAGAAEAVADGKDTYDEMTAYISCAAASIKEGKHVPEKPPCPVYDPHK